MPTPSASTWASDPTASSSAAWRSATRMKTPRSTATPRSARRSRTTRGGSRRAPPKARRTSLGGDTGLPQACADEDLEPPRAGEIGGQRLADRVRDVAFWVEAGGLGGCFRQQGEDGLALAPGHAVEP